MNRNKFTLKLVASFWFCCLSIPIIYLSGYHLFSFNKVKLNTDSLTSQLNSEKIEIFHFLGSTCGCSRKIMKYLIQRKPSDIFTENIFLIEDKPSKWKQQLEASGYKVISITEELAQTKYKIMNVPQLAIFSHSKLEYQGGYNENQMHNTNYKDIELAQMIAQNNNHSEYPLFGCANGKLTKNMIDPLGVKYDN